MRTFVPTCLAVTGLVSLLLGGCYPACGDYSALTGMEMVIGEDVYDFDRDDMFESCGSGFGAFGDFDLLDETTGYITFMPDHRNMEVDTHICTALFYIVNFDNRSLVVGQDLEIIDGEAGIYAVQAVPLVSGSIEVLDSRDPDEECAPFREQDYKLNWELEYSDNGGHLYTTQGKDWVGIGLPMAYGDPGC